ARKAPSQKRSISQREQPTAIISMAQQARPNVIGHMLDSRAQLMACSSVEVMTFSSEIPSSQPILQLPEEPLACASGSYCHEDALTGNGTFCTLRNGVALSDE